MGACAVVTPVGVCDIDAADCEGAQVPVSPSVEQVTD